MIYPSADKLEMRASKYSLVVLAARRAKQLKGGALPMIETASRNPLTVALEEIAAGKIDCRHPDNDIIPTTIQEPEVAALLAIPAEERVEEAAEVAEMEAGVSAAISEEAPVAEDEDFEDLEGEEEEEEEEEIPVYVGDEDETDLTGGSEEEEQPHEEEDIVAPPKGRRKKAAEPAVDVDVDAIEADDVIEDVEEEEEVEEEE